MNTTRSSVHHYFVLLVATAALFAFSLSCKKDTPTDPAVLTSLQGTWKLTSLNVSPAYLSLTDLAGGLNALEGNCLGQATVTFTAAGAITNNVSSVAACSTAAKSKELVNAFFSSATTYAETNNQVVLTTGSRVVTASKVFTATTATMVTQLDVDPGNNPVKTTYTVVLTKQ
ncbi:hypothetical protein J2I47_14880 [Fibrella sp. HMF5335]|uniref:Lipocalin-like domain-containing protein n=1 Tax=Fibrella rubiginis TaxID=2817060 RepID=A0A939K615_9BACT|nr:hypothetical protein [Fibrella rubiginis]MBO0937841.1 hypothetical protein [Fibrella rubiginis]